MAAPAFLKDWRSNRGLVVSVSAHALLLGATLVAFSRTPPYEDATEAIPVEMISTAELSQVMKGEKSAKVVKPTPKADKIADVHETKPLPPVAEAKKDVPLPPPPLKRLADPGEDDAPKPEPQKVAALPPPRPVVEPPKPEPKPVPPAPPQRPQEVKAVEEKPAPDDAEAVRPKPVERPKEIAKVEPKPAPPQPPKPQLKVDEVAKLLEKTKPEPTPKPAARPKSGEDSQEPKSALDLTAISKLLDHDKPQRRQATGAQLQHVAAVGAPNASASKMAPSMWDSLAGIIAEQYQRCWSQSGRSLELNYFPVVRVNLRVDGGLASAPVLTNPAGDPDRRALGEAAIRAIRMCDPLRIPAQFASFHNEWKTLPVKMRTEN